MINKTDIDVLADMLKLLYDQQKTSERTGSLVESMAMDMVRFREQSEKIAIITSRIDSMEDDIHNMEIKRTSCAQSMADQIRQLEQKREQNKDSINSVEHKLTMQIGVIKDRMQENIQTMDARITAKLDDLKEKLAYSSGKYGGIVALLTSLIAMALNWILSHGIPHK